MDWHALQARIKENDWKWRLDEENRLKKFWSAVYMNMLKMQHHNGKDDESDWDPDGKSWIVHAFKQRGCREQEVRMIDGTKDMMNALYGRHFDHAWLFEQVALGFFPRVRASDWNAMAKYVGSQRWHVKEATRFWLYFMSIGLTEHPIYVTAADDIVPFTSIQFQWLCTPEKDKRWYLRGLMQPGNKVAFITLNLEKCTFSVHYEHKVIGTVPFGEIMVYASRPFSRELTRDMGAGNNPLSRFAKHPLFDKSTVLRIEDLVIGGDIYADQNEREYRERERAKEKAKEEHAETLLKLRNRKPVTEDSVTTEAKRRAGTTPWEEYALKGPRVRWVTTHEDDGRYLERKFVNGIEVRHAPYSSPDGDPVPTYPRPAARPGRLTIEDDATQAEYAADAEDWQRRRQPPSTSDDSGDDE